MRCCVYSILLFLSVILAGAGSNVHCISASDAHSSISAGPDKQVLLITVNGIINPVAAEYIGGAVRQAVDLKAEALIIKLDTPGGLDSSMRSIVRDVIA